MINFFVKTLAKLLILIWVVVFLLNYLLVRAPDLLIAFRRLYE